MRYSLPDQTTQTAVDQAVLTDPQIAAMGASADVKAVPFARDRHMVWRRFGSGKPLVLFHGGHGDWMHWIRNVSALAKIREVWIPDLPGFGDSDALLDPTFAQLCDATLTTLNTLIGAATPADLAGFSFGGMVAAKLAARRPTSSRVLVASGGHGAPRRTHAPLLNWRHATSLEERLAMLYANVRTFMFYKPEAVTSQIERIYARQCVRTQFRSRGSWDPATLTDFLAASDAETLLLWGDQDVTLADPAAFFTSLRDAGVQHDFSLISDAGHWLQCEAADAVNAAMLSFYERV